MGSCNVHGACLNEAIAHVITLLVAFLSATAPIRASTASGEVAKKIGGTYTCVRA